MNQNLRARLNGWLTDEIGLLVTAALVLLFGVLVWAQPAQTSPPPSLNRLAVVKDGPVTLTLYRDPSSGTCLAVASGEQDGPHLNGTHVAVTSYPCSGR